MKLTHSLHRAALTGMAAVAGVLFSAAAVAAPVGGTAGGATIHNAATLSYNGNQQVTSWINVDVLTIGTAPTFDLTTTGPIEVNAGDTVQLDYTITANANGVDSYTLSATTSTTTDMVAGTTFTPSTGSVSLGASVSVAPTVSISPTVGRIFIPFGSNTELDPGDIVVINGNEYSVDAVNLGSIASTTLHTTTAEVHTSIDLVVPFGGSAPIIGNNTFPAGTHIGERQSFSIDVTVTAPTTVGTDGSVNPVVTGSTSALDTVTGLPVGYDTGTDPDAGNDIVITVLSATVSIVKEARNVTKGVLTFAATGVNAQSGDTLEYRIRMTALPGTGDATASVLTDILPEYTTYVAGSTELNGVAVTDDVGVLFPLDAVNGGLEVNSVNGAAGVLVDGDVVDDAATVTFQVEVQ